MGRILLLHWKLHFLLNPLHFLGAHSLFSIRSLMEWVGQARLGPLDLTSEGTWLCRRELGKPCCPGVLREAGFGRLLPCRPHLPAGLPPARGDLREAHNSFQRSLSGQQFCGPCRCPLLLGQNHHGECLGRSHIDPKPCPAHIAAMEKSEEGTCP